MVVSGTLVYASSCSNVLSHVVEADSLLYIPTSDEGSDMEAQNSNTYFWSELFAYSWLLYT